MILYIENPKDANNKKNLLGLINEFSKDAGYQMNTQKSVVFPHTNKEISEKENPFTIAPKIIKHLGINLTKEVKDLCTKNYRHG